MNKRGKQLLLMLLTAITVIGGYAFLRYAYGVTESMPFTQEIVLIILGTVATVLITALLLNQQSIVEIEKEQSIKFIELKTRTYEQLIGQIEEMTLSDTVTEKDLIRLRFITHRLAIFSSPAVLAEYHHFLDVLGDSTQDGRLRDTDADALSKALASLTVKIRADLIGDMDMLGDYSQAQIARMILKNSDESTELRVDA